MRNRIDTYKPTGNLQIIKVWENKRSVPENLRGTREVIFSERNTIVSGMGVGLTYLFTASGSSKITDYQIRWFQVGTSGYPSYDLTTYKLNTPLSSIAQYGEGTNLMVSSLSQIQNGSLTLDKIFAYIPPNLITKVAPTSVKYVLSLDANTANDLPPINEIGLFMHNPKNLNPAATILCAYKKFNDIEKTSDFSLLFNWIVTF